MAIEAEAESKSKTKRWVAFPGRLDYDMSSAVASADVTRLDSEQLDDIQCDLFSIKRVRWLALAVDDPVQYKRVHRERGATPLAAVLLGTTALEVSNAVRRAALPSVPASAVDLAVGAAINWVRPRLEEYRKRSPYGEGAALGFGSGMVIAEQTRCATYVEARKEACERSMVAVAQRKCSRLAASLPVALLLASYALYNLGYPAERVRVALKAALVSAIDALHRLSYGAVGRAFSPVASAFASYDIETMQRMLTSYETNDGSLHGALEAAFPL